MLDPGIYAGSDMGRALASMVKGGEFITKILIVLLFFTLMLSIMTAMAGSSRTLHQGGRDGWLPKYLGQVNTHGAPTNAMWTDLAVNLVLLPMSDYVFVLAVSNCNYLIFNFLNLNAGWIHRMDNPDVPRPFKAPLPLFILGTCFAYMNVFLLGAGANVLGRRHAPPGLDLGPDRPPGLLLPALRHGQGQVPGAHVRRPLIPEGQTELGPTRGGVLPYVAVAGGLACMTLGYVIFWV